jgi:hypothetical protein
LASFVFFLFTCEKHTHLSLSRQGRVYFRAGFAVNFFKPSKGGGERVLNPNVIYRYHGKAVLVFVLGLLLGSSNPAKEEEREFLTQTSSIIITAKPC